RHGCGSHLQDPRWRLGQQYPLQRRQRWPGLWRDRGGHSHSGGDSNMSDPGYRILSARYANHDHSAAIVKTEGTGLGAGDARERPRRWTRLHSSGIPIIPFQRSGPAEPMPIEAPKPPDATSVMFLPMAPEPVEVQPLPLAPIEQPLATPVLATMQPTLPPAP